MLTHNIAFYQNTPQLYSTKKCLRVHGHNILVFENSVQISSVSGHMTYQKIFLIRLLKIKNNEKYVSINLERNPFSAYACDWF